MIAVSFCRHRRLGWKAAGLSTAAFIAFNPITAANAQLGAPEAMPKSEDEIVITARRQNETLYQTGAAVSALSEQEILESRTNSIEQLNERFVALTVQPASTGNLVFIRGVGNFTLQPNSDPAVGFADDGVFIARPIGTQIQFFDLDRIELVKGPQGVLYGRNASAGSLNIEPNQPVFGDLVSKFHFSTDTIDNHFLEGMVNVPLGTESAIRLAGAFSDRDNLVSGYRDGPEQWSARLQFKSRTSANSTLRVVAERSEVRGVGNGSSYVGKYLFNPAQSDYVFLPSDLSPSEGLLTADSQAFRETIYVPLAGRNLDPLGSAPRQRNDVTGLHARFDADLGFAQLVALPAWRLAKIDLIAPGAPFGLQQDERQEQLSFEARLNGKVGRLDWLAGTFLFKEKIDGDAYTNLSASLILTEQSFRTSSQALFGNLTYNLSPSARISGGLRWTRDYKSFRSSSQTATIICLAIVDNRPNCPAVPLFQLVDTFAAAPFDVPANSGGVLPIVVGGLPTGAIVSRSDRAFRDHLVDRALTWRVGAEFDLGPRTLLYANAETGNRPGGLNAAVGYETYDPERIRAFTLGLRHRSQDDRLKLALEAFWWDYQDQQVSALRPDLASPPVNSNITQTIGRSRIRGIEGEFSFRPWKGMKVDTSVQYLDARYRSFAYEQANLGAPPLTGCATELDTGRNIYTVDCRRQQPYNSPRWSAIFSGRQSVDLGSSKLTAVVDTRFRSARNIGFAFLPEQRISSSWTTNIQLILDLPRHDIQLAGFVQNIENNRISEFSIFHPMSNALIASGTAPRRWGIRLGARF